MDMWYYYPAQFIANCQGFATVAISSSGWLLLFFLKILDVLPANNAKSGRMTRTTGSATVKSFLRIGAILLVGLVVYYFVSSKISSDSAKQRDQMNESIKFMNRAKN